MAGKKIKGVRGFLPAAILNGLRNSRAKKREPIRFTGDFETWKKAEQKSIGYGASEILEKTRAALLKVKAGGAAFERDSVTFAAMQHEFSLLAGLLRVALGDDGRLSVLDFGGSLGGTYFQCREYLSPLNTLHWSVVDQPAQVACGKLDFANSELHFYETILECLSERQPNALLLSSVLQYLPEPYQFLEDILREGFPYVIIERTAFNCSGRNRLTVQHVPAWIYDASYPAWFLSEASVRRLFAANYELVGEYEANEDLHPENGKAVFKGFQFQRKSR